MLEGFKGRDAEGSFGAGRQKQPALSLSRRDLAVGQELWVSPHALSALQDKGLKVALE